MVPRNRDQTWDNRVLHPWPVLQVQAHHDFQTTAAPGQQAGGFREGEGMSDTFIGPDHPRDGRDWECQCARCGSSMYSEECGQCDDGLTPIGELYEQDPLWYDEDAQEPCSQCGGEGSWMLCMSTAEWCESHPLAGRETTPRNTVEWFVVETRKQA
jgi:hypothetical protein